MHRRDSSMTTTVARVRTRTALTVAELRLRCVVTAAYASTVTLAPYLYASFCMQKCASP
jgi:hypothetical protein